MHHLAGDVLGNGQRDDVGVGVDLGDHAACFGTGEATKVGAEAQLDFVRVGGVDVEVDDHLGGSGVVEPVQERCAGGPQYFGAKTVRPHSSAIAGSVGSVQSCMPTSAMRSGVVVAGRMSRSSESPWPVSAETTMAW